MFDSIVNMIEPSRVAQFRLTRDAKPLSYEQVLHLWTDNQKFREFFSQTLADSEFDAFRWETPALTRATSKQSFEYVLLNTPDFSTRPPDAAAFAEYFVHDDTDDDIVSTVNLGGDSSLLIPSPRGADSIYGHFASFLREAPQGQVDRLWQSIGTLVSSALSETPIWLNTAGGGIAWLHVRLDSRPKYYGYRPYKSMPQ